MPLEQKKYPVGAHPDLPPPVSTTGPLAWIKTNLFSSPLNTALTILSLWLLWTIVPPFINWVFFESYGMLQIEKIVGHKCLIQEKVHVGHLL